MATYLAFHSSFTYFGILHGVVLASLLGLIFSRLPIALVFLASFVSLATPLFSEASIFDTRFPAWIGIAAAPLYSNDFVRVSPWFGMTLADIGCTRLLLTRQSKRDRRPWCPRAHLSKDLTWVRPRTLHIYLLHQPLLFAGFSAFRRLFPRVTLDSTADRTPLWSLRMCFTC